jgi:trehalose-6-phosphate hydrolase
VNNFRNSTVYQIYIKSFKDTNGSGEGDIKGIIEKLDYLSYLGINYIWITPFFKSPQRDNGYDISNYFIPDERYGETEDIYDLIDEAKKRNIGLIFDMVLNHTSSEHEWFKKALAGDKKYQDYYFFKEGKGDNQPPTNWESKFGGPAWKYVKELDKWYLHLFDETQIDLNWDNPEVREEVKKIVKFWKDKGVEGFRFDVINLISKPELFEDSLEGNGKEFYTDGRNVHEYIQELVRDCGIKDYLTVGELSSTSVEQSIKYSNPANEELKMVFSFYHLKVDYKNANKWDLEPLNIRKLKDVINYWQEGMQEGKGWNALFWSNHDQPRVLSRFGNDDGYHFESATMLATSMYLLRGTPFLYQGEEIGMTNAYFDSIDQYRDVESTNYYNILLSQNRRKEEVLKILQERSRDNARTPMQWDSSELSGFSKEKSWIEVNKNYKQINVEKQIEDSSSILHFYKAIIDLRKASEVIANGKYEPLLLEHEAVFAYRRSDENEEYLIISNFSSDSQNINLNAKYDDYDMVLRNYEGFKDFCSDLSLAPYEAVVFHRNK